MHSFVLGKVGINKTGINPKWYSQKGKKRLKRMEINQPKNIKLKTRGYRVRWCK
jgi:hypothetical protein